MSFFSYFESSDYVCCIQWKLMREDLKSFYYDAWEQKHMTIWAQCIVKKLHCNIVTVYSV